MTPKTSRAQIIGNLSLVTRGELVELTLNTYHKGRPYALFKRSDLPEVAAWLLAHGKPAPEADDDDWRDLI